MTDPRYIPPSDRVPVDERCPGTQCYGSSSTYREMYNEVLDHAAFMDERDARQRDLIRRLAASVQAEIDYAGCMCPPVYALASGQKQCAEHEMLIEARGVEATNE